MLVICRTTPALAAHTERPAEEVANDLYYPVIVLRFDMFFSTFVSLSLKLAYVQYSSVSFLLKGFYKKVAEVSCLVRSFYMIHIMLQ